MSAGTRFEFDGNPSHIHTVFEKSLDWPRWNTRHVSNFTGSDACVFEDTFLHLIHIFSVLLFDSCSEQPTSSAEIAPFLGLKNYTKIMFFSVSASKSCINITKVSVAFSPSLNQNLIQTCCSFRSVFCCVPQNHKGNSTHIYLSRCYPFLPAIIVIGCL